MNKPQPEQPRLKVPPEVVKKAVRMGLYHIGYIPNRMLLKANVEIYRTAQEDIGAWVTFPTDKTNKKGD